MGLVMPNVTTAVQNAVARQDLGVATATLGFFRSLGGAFGVAASGMILAASLPRQSVASVGLTQIRTLPATARAELLDGYAHALGTTFVTAACVSALGCLALMMMPERALRSK